MDLRDYREMPDEGLFEKIERRVRLRRWTRLGGVVAAVVVLAAGAVWLLSQGVDESKSRKVEKSKSQRVEEYLPLNTKHMTPSSDPQLLAMQSSGEVREVSDAASQRVVAPASTVKPTIEDSKSQRVEKSKSQKALNTQHLTLNTYHLPLNTQNLPLTTKHLPLNTKHLTPSSDFAPAVLPPATVKSENVTFDDFVVETMEDDTAIVATAKDGGTAPVQPHYDNVLWAPNIIMPMADAEENRVFKVKSTSAVSNFRMVVYSRDGRPVFSSNDINQGWDARRDGSLVPQGTYVWIARFRDSAGSIRQEKGTVTVVR